jgi:cell division initiation protein
MRISPIDIQQQQFKSRPFGYEKSGVDRFLESLAEELERLLRQNQDLKEELAHANATLGEMRDREEMLKETLVTTQRITEALKSTARREVDVMMAEAEIKAERLMRNAEERRLQLIEEIQEIKRQKIDFEVSLRGLLEKHVRMLELNTVAIDQQGTEARLLEEPLPFVKQVSPKKTGVEVPPVETVSEPVEEAEFAEMELPDLELEAPFARKTQDLSFNLDMVEENGEEDVLT